MYAVIRVGTSQERVTEGQVVRVDLRPEEIGADVQFEPVLLVDGDSVVAGPGVLRLLRGFLALDCLLEG